MSKKRRESTPQYPKYFTGCPDRTLAFYTPSTGIITEDGDTLHIGDNLSTLKETLWTYNLLLFVDNMLSFPHLYEAIYDEHCSVSCTAKGEPIGLKITGERNTTRWIVSMHRWNLACSLDTLHVLRSLYTHCGVGAAPTPGGLGQALMRTTWKEHNLPRHTRPHSGCIDMLVKHSFGGRVDTPGIDHRDAPLMELDRKNAYAAEYGKHPTGTATRIASQLTYDASQQFGVPANFVTWFGQCRIEIPSPGLRYGPFPVRLQSGQVGYPTEPGIYTSHLWREQAIDIRSEGGTVELLDGWGWEHFTDNNQHWVAIAEHLRRTATTKEIEALVKLAIVAGIGRHAMQSIMYCLIPEEQWQSGDEPVAESGLFGACYVHKFHDPQHCNMVHWNSYTVMQMSRALYHFALPYAELGWLVSTNYDAITLKLWRYEELSFPEKGSREDKEGRSGIWRRRMLYPNPDNDRPMVGVRSVNAIDKHGNVIDIRPGVKRPPS